MVGLYFLKFIDGRTVTCNRAVYFDKIDISFFCVNDRKVDES